LKLTPVDLRLLARQRAQPQVGPGHRARAVAGHDVAEVIAAHDAGLGEHALDGVAVQVQLAGDGAHAPVLGLVQAQDLRAQFRGYGHGWAPPCGWRRAAAGCGAGSSAVPGARKSCGTKNTAKPVSSR